jgi:NO-binding membrane sensor protein with MHYT domain
MFTAWTCITDQHDTRLLAVALVICVISAATGLSVYARAASAQAGGRVGWSAFAGIVTGCGVWATHFLAMLAYQADISIAYAFDLTALSLAAAVVILSCGFFTAARSRRMTGRVLGGVIVGAGVAAMHLVGVAAMTGPTVLSRDFGLLAAAVMVALAASAAAMRVVGAGSSPRRGQEGDRSHGGEMQATYAQDQ